MTTPRTDPDPGTAGPDPGTAGHDPGGPEEEPERPLGISLLTWLFWFWAGAIGLVLLGFAIGDGPIMMSGRAVPRSEALRAVLPALAAMGLAVVGAALALALERPWARPAVLLPFALAALGPAMTGVGARSPVELGLASLAVLPVLAILGWYLYARPRTTAYFDRLRSRRRPGGAS